MAQRKAKIGRGNTGQGRGLFQVGTSRLVVGDGWKGDIGAIRHVIMLDAVGPPLPSRIGEHSLKYPLVHITEGSLVLITEDSFIEISGFRN